LVGFTDSTLNGGHSLAQTRRVGTRYLTGRIEAILNLTQFTLGRTNIADRQHGFGSGDGRLLCRHIGRPLDLLGVGFGSACGEERLRGGLETLPQGAGGGPTAATGGPPLIHQLLELTGRTVPVSRRRERLSLGDERLLGCGDCGVLLVKMSEVCLACLLERGTRLGEPLPQLPFDVLADASAGSLRFLPLIKQFAHARGVV